MLKEMHERFPDTVSEVMTLQKKHFLETNVYL
jgi:hypothetical protein